MKVTVQGPNMVAALQQTTRRASDTVKTKMAGAMQKAQQAILNQGRQDIQSAGKFGSRWTDGLTADIEEEEKMISITVREAVPYWRVFQDGKTIRGQPLLYFKPGVPILNRKGQQTNPEVISVPQVTIPKKFHLVEICRDVADTLGQLYKLYQAGA